MRPLGRRALAVVGALACGVGAVPACARVEPEFITPGRADSPTAIARPHTRAGNPLAADLLAFVVVEREHRGGYRRELFAYPHPTGHGCDTRDRVLELESSTPVRFTSSGCNIARGTWTSVYDGVAYTSPSGLEIDHVVALKEAWDSGAWRWSRAALEAFANDVTDGRTLQAVSSKSNRAKGDKDPSNWLPPNGNDVCRYAGDWVAIKVRWHLSMDPSEFGRLRNLFRGSCSGWTVAPFPRTPVPVP